MRYLKLNIRYRLLTEAQFPPWKGSMLRGAMGTNLRRGLCMIRKDDCETCTLGANCAFPRIFKPLQSSPKGQPPPFVIEPDLSHKTAYAPGDLFKFDLKLFSYAVEYLPFFVQAFRMAGEKGLGNPRLPGKAELHSVTYQGHDLFDANNDQLHIPVAENLSLPELIIDRSIHKLELNFLTPLRYKSSNQFSSHLDFSALLNLLLRRIKALQMLDNEKWRLEPENFSFLQELATQIRIENYNLNWLDLGRYSSRQEKAMKFGGLTGKITFKGPTLAFKNFLDFAAKVHIGKQCSFGLGLMNFQYLKV